MTSESFWNYYRDEVNDNATEVNADNYRTNNNNTTASRSFEYKTEIIGSTPDNNNMLKTEDVVPLKYLRNFWISLDLPLIDCKLELDMTRRLYNILNI